MDAVNYVDQLNWLLREMVPDYNTYRVVFYVGS